MRAAWAGEPVKAVIVTDDAFLTNNQGFPVLPKVNGVTWLTVSTSGFFGSKRTMSS